jgi:hypothetical protein
MCPQRFTAGSLVLSVVYSKRWGQSQALVAPSCNPSYSGGTDQEDHGSKPAWVNSSVRTYLKKSFTKIGLVEWLKVKALSSSPSTEKEKNKRGKTRQVAILRKD